MKLQMYLAGTLIDEVHLNLNGLNNQLEISWYYEGTIKALLEKHSERIAKLNIKPTFELEGIQTKVNTFTSLKNEYDWNAILGKDQN